jgi:hypothetical protein
MTFIKKLVLVLAAIGILVASLFLSIFVLGLALALGLVVAARIWWLGRKQQGSVIEGEYRKLDE